MKPIMQNVDVFKGQKIINLWRDLHASDHAELYAYRVYAHSLYEQLVPALPENALFAHPLWPSVVLHDERVATREVGNGIMLYDIRDFIAEYPALAQKYLFNASTQAWRERKVCALIEGCWNRGMVLFVPPSVRFAPVLDVRALLASYDDTVLIEKCVIIIESNAQITIIDRVDRESVDAHIIMRALDYKIGEYALVDIHMISNVHSSAYEYVRTTLHASAKSQVTFTSFTRGSASSVMWLDCFLQDKGASIRVRSAGALSAQRHATMITQQHHKAAGTASDLLAKNCLAQASSFDYTGSIHIATQAAKTSAHQRNMNLLLHDGARACSLPSLEVLNNDVQCSHGSAIGQIDAQQLFYLQSRGLSHHQALDYLIHGFLAEVFIEVAPDLDRVYRQEIVASMLEDE